MFAFVFIAEFVILGRAILLEWMLKLKYRFAVLTADQSLYDFI